ncbi:class I SAM-dependent methyltransferase [Nodularia sp. UHCC 0506]|uniref:class I SAM-dependent DNA methyltransferase n=1 Tax=Nodularia sp. UHCC 0506 TaxID=3110243 RepID=UPI002B21D4A7|nr:class I SAM-dependent methyltransferase [Nodularia sp. UHCC 0506]MEA5516077.1 class I SAM-dependent methyltransferase [Nodularia sp. UHCC 0506]
MTTTNRYSEYDLFAPMYNDNWGNLFKDGIPLPIKTLMLQHLPPQAHILDLCCGTGQLVEKLLIEGYQVTGIDGSESMLKYAKENAPQANFILEDARYFNLLPTFNAAISIGSSLNHILTLDELKLVFANVYNSLQPGGLFGFTIDVEGIYQSKWDGSSKGVIKDEYVWVWQRKYLPDANLGQVKIAILQLVNGQWERSDITWLLKSYKISHIESALQEVGFKNIEIYDLKQDLKLLNNPQESCFVAHKLS